jgi:Zn-dependent protease with chaperone function
MYLFISPSFLHLPPKFLPSQLLPSFISVHSVMIGGALILAWLLRYGWRSPHDYQPNLQERWQKALVRFVLSPLLVFVNAIAILSMGSAGQMMGVPVGKVSYAIAGIFLLYCGGRILQLILTGWQSLKRLENLAIAHSDHDIAPSISADAKLIDINLPFAAQLGFWRSRLFVSTGLLNTLDASHLEAVLCHERAHAHYHDTFWFFWLGCCRQIMPWLPNTQALWEELLLLRELRADLWAAQYADSLLLAESLVVMVQNRIAPEFASEFTSKFTFTAAFGENQNNCVSRLEERINFLLTTSESLPKFSWRSFLWLGFALMPLIAMPLHS